MLVILIVCLCLSLTTSASQQFPDHFLFGYASASYQVEGAWNEDGKGENIWDRLTHTRPETVFDKSNGDESTDQYHKYEEDVQILRFLEAKVYRFSLSWSRLYPDIRTYQVNQKGVNYYNKLINNLLANNITPMVTLYHWDLPQYLQDLGGWTNPHIIDYYEDFAYLAFQEFGDRVPYWITFNEPLETCQNHYGGLDGAPMLNMSGIADYLCAHTILQAHARAYHLYNNTFKSAQKGLVGIALNGGWNEPKSKSAADITAAETMNLFQIGWFADPIFGADGDYTPVMRENIDRNSKAEGRTRSRLPVFDLATKLYMKGTFDFYGMNHYSTRYATPAPSEQKVSSWMKDTGVRLEVDAAWPGSASSWLKVVPWGFRKVLNFVKERYNNVPVIVTENGFSDSDGLNDDARILYYRDYLTELLKAIKEDGCNVKGYMAWSITDNFEWLRGYSERFGVVHVNFTDPERKRTLKKSALFMKELYDTGKIPSYDIRHYEVVHVT